MIQVNKIKLGYDNHIVIDDLSLEIESHKITTIIGANGCGKSTLLKSLARYLRPYEGSILLDGQNVDHIKHQQLAKRMAVLPQIRHIPGDVKVKTLVSYGRYPYMRFGKRLQSEDFEIIDWALEKTGLSHMKNRRVSTLSGGEQQRAWIAMAVAQKTEILILDEPTTYLDIAYQLEVLELVQDLNRELKLTIIMVLHDINHAARYSHRIIAMKDGGIHTYNTSDNVVKSDVLEDVFNIEARMFDDDVNDCVYVIPQKIKRRL
ncbi:ABC transporter ATP-binding protein [Acidaminobacter sp. JC074]|uniref:ABC transporter ATP-binding protein n=1 Tax=Acidaminobacter sp. JC074 TaxID=2530199 RepID=UPI001F101BE8|nr:ABC transporter ATP-binding protein [Acidaminobacter sp. JC074]MCH4891051.1 ABC transporter ATP-binding protein [Acidaminobacter sp. JC074]